MQTRTRNFILTGSVFTLCAEIAGCTSSGRFQAQMDGLARSPLPAVYAGSSEGGLREVLQEAEAALPALSSAIRRNEDGTSAGVELPEPGAAYVESVAGDGTGGFRVTYVVDDDEIPVHLTPEHREQDAAYPGIRHYFLVRPDADIRYYFWPWTKAADGQPEFDYLDVYGWSVGRPDAVYSAFSVFGLRTPASELPQGTAVYAGRMAATVWDANDGHWGNQRSLQGNLTLQANLDDLRLAGRIDDLRLGSIFSDDASHRPLAGDNWIDVSGAMIDEHGRLTASWTGHGPEAANLPQGASYGDTVGGFAGTIVGEFYGPAGEEIGGVLSGRRGAVDATPEQLLIGGFGAARQDG